MRYIDIQKWPRRDLFNFFKNFDHPHTGLCANVDLTEFHRAMKQSGYSINMAIVYVISRVSNAIPEFRYRIRKEDVVEHPVVHPSMTIQTDNNLFSFCSVDYTKDLALFAEQTSANIAHMKQYPRLDLDQGRDDLIFLTMAPWVSFTGCMHAMNLNPVDSVPRFGWGKFFQDGTHLKMPLSVQVHHALADGFHMGKFYSEVQNYLHHPDLILK